jgi:hypothetical protein
MRKDVREALEAARGSLSQAGTIFSKAEKRGSITEFQSMALTSCRHSYILVQEALDVEEPSWVKTLHEMPDHQRDAFIMAVKALDLEVATGTPHRDLKGERDARVRALGPKWGHGQRT